MLCFVEYFYRPVHFPEVFVEGRPLKASDFVSKYDKANESISQVPCNIDGPDFIEC